MNSTTPMFRSPCLLVPHWRIPPPPRRQLWILLLVILISTALVADAAAYTPYVVSHRAHLTNIHTPQSHRNPSWTPPVEGATEADVLRRFDAPAQPWSAGHRGIDLRALTTTVRAPHSGVVHFVGMVAGRPVLTIAHPNGMLSTVEPVVSELSIDDHVEAGHPIGIVDEQTAHCAVDCVHWGVRIPDAWVIGNTVRDRYVDPEVLLGWAEPSVLWPIDSDPR